MPRKQDGPPKVSYGIRVQPHIFAAVEAIAKDKRWSESKTTDYLLEWTVAQLGIVGSFDALMKSSVRRAPGQIEALEQFNKQHEELTHGAGAKSKKKAS